MLDSLQLGLSNAVGGNLRGVGASFMTPSQTTPEERRKVSDRLGLTGTFLAPLVDISTNPLVLIGAVMAWKWGLPTVAALRTYKGEFDKIGRSSLPLLEKLAPFRTVFAGSKLPDDFDLAARRFLEPVSKSWEKLHAVFRQHGDPTREEWVRIAASLDGLNATDPVSRQSARVLSAALRDDEVAAAMGFTPAQRMAVISKLQQPIAAGLTLTAKEQGIRDGMRSVTDDLWESVFSKVQGDPNAERVANVLFGSKSYPKEKLPQYWSRFANKSELELTQELEALTNGKIPVEELTAKEARYRARLDKSLRSDQTSHRLDERTGLLMPAADDLRALGVDDDIIQAAERFSTVFTKGKTYSLGPDSFRRYIDTAGRVHAWGLPTAAGTEPIGVRVAAELSKLRLGNPLERSRASMLERTYIPMALGRMTPNQLSRSATWESMKYQTMQFLEKMPFLGDSFKATARKALLEDRNSSYPAVGQTISNYLYGNLLGFNVTSAVQNLSQNVTTLVPVVGTKAFTGALDDVFKGTMKAYELKGKGLSADEAFRGAFPDFHAMHVELDPTSGQVLRRSLESMWDELSVLPKGSASQYEKFQQKMLHLFSKSEQTNRLIAFYASKRKFLDEFRAGKMAGHQFYNPTLNVMEDATKANVDRLANEFARENVGRTAFGGGPLERPSGIADWWAPFRQFLGYPMRTASLYLNEGLQHPGLIGAGLAASGVAYGVGRELGADWSNSLLFGAAPFANEGQPFAPFPAPPLVGLAGSAAIAGVTGDTKPLLNSLPMLVPGGPVLARAAGAAGLTAVSQPLGRPSVDWGAMTPDGRVPVFSATGQLQGYQTPMDILSRAILGSRPISEMQAMEFQKIITGAGDRIQGMKKQARQALLDNDGGALQRVSLAWQAAFPNSGDLPLDDVDIRSIHLQRDVTRLERSLESLPPEVRSQYMGVIATSMASDMDAFMGLTTPLSAGNTMAQREGFRAVKMADRKKQLEPSLHGMKIQDKLKAAGLQSGQAPSGAASSFGGFGSFGGAP